MGAWGVGIFEDDVNLDWIEEGYAEGGVEAVRGALSLAAESSAGDYLEYEDCATARVAAEVVATCFDAPHPNLGRDNKETLLAHQDDVQQDRELIDLALSASVRLASENAELHELWIESEEAAAQWTSEMEGLVTRLRGAQ